MRVSVRPTGFRDPGPVPWRWMVLLVLAAALLRFANLNSDLWLDEIGTLVTYVRLPMDQIVRTYGSMNQHLLYSILARMSVLCFGESAWALRLPAALFGVAAIPALYYAACVMTSEREALLASAMLAFSYHHIWFSQDARGYSAMVFFSLLGTGFLIRGIAREGWGYWVAYVLSMTLGVVSLQNTAFVVVGQWLCCILLLGWKRSARMHVSVGAIALLALLCHSLMLREMLLFMRNADRAALGWTKISELVPVIGQGLIAGLGIAGLLAIGLVGVSGFWSYWKQTRFLAGLLVFPVLLNIVVLAVLRIGAYPRSFLYELPFALLIAVRGATELCKRYGGERSASAVCLVTLALASIPLISYYRFPKQDFSGALAYVRARAASDDVVMGADLAGTCYRRYYFTGIAIATTPEQIEALRKSGRRVWVLYSFPREFSVRSPDLFRYLRTQLASAAVFHGTLGGGDVYIARSR